MKTFHQLRKHRRLYKAKRWFGQHFAWLIRFTQWLAKKLAFLRILRFLNPFRYIKRMDWYIIKKFVGTYFFSILLIISVAIVFDVNDNLPKFTENHAPLRAIVFDYYLNFVPYFANLLVRCLSSLPSSSLHLRWLATLRLSPSWHQASHSSGCCALT